MAKSRIVIAGDVELKAKLKKLGQAVIAFNKTAALEAADIIEDAAEAKAPGPHIYSVLVRADENQAEVHIGPDKDHWFYQFIETGATPHEISGSPLVFEGIKGLVITKKVKHTGFPARPFLRPAMNSKKDEAKAKAGQVFRSAIERAANNGS